MKINPKIKKIKPPHVSIYSLDIEEETPLHKLIRKRKIELPSSTVVSKQFDLINKSMGEMNYINYEISSFCKKGFKSKHNSNYWCNENYIGYGPGAHSYDKKYRYWNIRDNKEYVNRINNRKSYFESEKLTNTQKINEFIITRIRTMEGINNLELKNLNGICLFKEKDKEIKYLKDKALLLIKEGKIFKSDENIEISSKNIEYKIDKSNLKLKKNVRIKDNNNNLLINSSEMNYDVINQLITSKTESEIFDNFGNIYKVKEFEYSIEKKVIKLSQLKAFDVSKNSFIVDLAYMDLKKKELLAKDVDLNFKISENSENEPRLKGKSLIYDENNTTVQKGTFTFCKKREKCPPWEMSAKEIRHDKKKKTINIPYFFAMAENKDITISPRFFFDDQILLQSEFRQKNKKSFHIADVSQYISNDNNSKGHFFYDFSKKYTAKNFNDIDLNVELQQVTDETYLKAFKVDSPIIKNKTKLKNLLGLDFYSDNLSINSSFDVYEDLSKADSDKFEYVPNFSFSNIINNNYSIDSSGYYKNYNTNIRETVLINNFNFQSTPRYFNNGIVNEKKFLLKNVNSKAKNSENFENNLSHTLLPTLQSTYTFPLIKNTDRFKNTLTPKFSLKFSPDYTKDIRNRSDGQIEYSNIYELNRLGIEEANEGGISISHIIE